MNADAKKRELLAALLRQRGMDPASLPIAPRPGDPGVAPLSFAQERLWLVERLEPGRPTYNEVYAACFTGELSPAALAAGLHETARRHAALRTTFGFRDGRPFQVISPEPRLPMPVVDLEGLPEDLRQAEADRRERAEAARPFDLERGPLVRALLLRLAPDEHRLVLSLHHIVCDATSIEILIRELVALHAAGVRGAASPLPEPRLQYADFAAWQRELQAPALERQLAEHKERLAGAPTVLELPADQPRSDRPRGRGAMLQAPLPAPLARGVKALAQAEGTTLFMALLTAFEALVARSTGKLDFLVGTPIAGRTRDEVRGMVGFFVNTLVLCAELDGDPSFRELLARTRRTVSAAYDRQDVPFSRLVEELRPERAASHAPLLQVLFLLQKPGVRVETGEGLDFELRRLDTGTAKFELTFLTGDAGDEIVCGVEYDTDLFLPATMARFLEHYRRLLESATADPDARLSELEILTPEERRQLAAWNETALARPQGVCVHELIAAQAERTPDAPAVISAERTLSYRELVADARRCAHRLRALGVGTDDRVGLCLQPSPDLMVALLGILEAGGAYVPLDPGQPAERLAWILEDTQLRVLVTESALAGRLPASAAAVVRIDAERAGWAALPADPLEPLATPGSLAYQIYTSGSTGRPKGVMVPHGGLVNLTLSFAEAFHLGPGERMLLLLSLAFDASVGDLFPPLVRGAALVVHRTPQALLGRELEGFLEGQRVTCLELAAAFWQQWAEDLAARGQAPPSSLRTLIAGGEAVAIDKVRTWFGLLGGRPFRFRNHYGPTEATVCATAFQVESAGEDLAWSRLPIGRPLPNVRIHLLDPALREVPAGVAGEICIGGAGVARGYLGRPDVTADRFIPDPHGAPGDRLYRTGDLARRLPGGELDFLGRVDHQVKIRGYRIEPGEIEVVLAGHPGLREAVVLARADQPGPARLVAYVVPAGEGAGGPGATELRAFLQAKLPAYMIPEAFVSLERLPLNTSGKVDRKALPRPVFDRGADEAAFVAPESELQRSIAAIWRELLGTERVGLHDNFFEIGGHSLLLVRMEGMLRDTLGRAVDVLELFRHPTIAALAEHLGGGGRREAAQRPRRAQRPAAGGAVAIVGLAGRFPGADDVDALWRNLREGVDAITFFTGEELLRAGVPAERLEDPGYVRARGVLRGADRFDAPFFGYSPREAEILDPQHRLFLACAWEALENAGYDPERAPGPIGVFGGVGHNGYFVNNLLSNPERLEAVGLTPVMLGNDKDFVPTRASYKLDLKGPAVLVQTACSTSLVAVHLASRSLLDGECDMALAGGATVPVPQTGGYVYEEGGIFSPDGRCRAFAAAAQGTVPGSGVALVVLKRLEDALADGDTIHAVLKGSAINNDGSGKVGYTAPSPNGQARVIREALERAGVEAGSISYVETHGTGTALGDVIEVAALREVFQEQTGRVGFCALGSLKSNVGHMDTAAGVGGLIKAALALRHGEIPPSLHVQAPNPKLGLEESPFFINDRLRPWPRNGAPRRAGVSSFGIGGTNAHVVLEEAPPVEPAAAGRPWQLLTLSGRTPGAVTRAAERLARHLEERPEVELADAAYTLHVGRRAFEHRASLVCGDRAEAVAALRRLAAGEAREAREAAAAPEVVFLFPGTGAQHLRMGRDLAASEAVFRETLDCAAELLAPELGRDLRRLLDPPAGEEDEAAAALQTAAVGMPAVFAVSYALARVWMSWGVRPRAMAGHSLGEYVAACLAGVLSFEDALALIALRGRLLDATPAGAMLSVPLPEAEVLPLLGAELSLAAVNAPQASVVSGPRAAVEAWERELAARGIEGRRLPVAVALHSRLVEPVLAEFRCFVETLPLRPPQIPFVSTVTGTWITAAEATDPDYWTAHVRRPVRFADAVAELARTPGRIFLEVGPGRILSAMTRQQVAPEQAGLVFASLPHPKEARSDLASALDTLGSLWRAGVRPDWAAFHAAERRRRVPLPTYPFADLRYWIEPGQEVGRTTPDFAERFWIEEWKRSPVPPGAPDGEGWELVDLRGVEDLSVRVAALEASLAAPRESAPRRIGLVTGGLAGEIGEEPGPAASVVLGLVRSLRRRGVDCRWVDATGRLPFDRLAAELAAAPSDAPAVAYRHGRRRVLAPDRLRLDAGLRSHLRDERVLVTALSTDPMERERAVERWSASGEPWVELAWDDLDAPGAPPPAAELREAVRRARALEPGTRVIVSAAGDLPARLAAVGRPAAAGEPVHRTGGARHPRPALPAPYEAPVTDLERGLAEIWQDTLGIEPVGLRDGYFELGGDSLLAIRLLGRVRQELGADVSLQGFLAEPTLAGLAWMAAAAPRTRETGRSIPRACRDAPLPLSFAQEEAWWHLRRPDGLPQHNTAIAYRAEGGLDRGVLESTLNEVARRHEILRTTFPEVSGRPVQKIASEVDMTVSLVDLSGLPADLGEVETHRLAVASYEERFDLCAGPLIRLTALRFGPRDHGLLLTIGRLVTDGGTQRVLLEELIATYEALLAGRRPRLREPTLQYADFAAWQRQAVERGDMREHLAYWLEKLRGAPDRLRLRNDFPRPPVQTFRGRREAVPLSPAATDALKALARAEGCTLFMVLLALYGVLLARYSGQEDFTVATPWSHRDPETESVMGRFLNTLALRFDLSGDPSFREHLHRVRETCFGAYAHKDLPYERLLEELRPVSDPGFRPLCQAAFLLQELVLPDLRLGELVLLPFVVDRGAADFEVTLGFSQEASGGLDGFLEYMTDLYSAATAAEMAQNFQILTAAVVGDPRLRVSELLRRTGGGGVAAEAPLLAAAG